METKSKINCSQCDLMSLFQKGGLLIKITQRITAIVQPLTV